MSSTKERVATYSTLRVEFGLEGPKDQRANRRRRGSRGGRPAGFDKETYKRRKEVERTINRLKHFRAVATRYDKRAFVFHGTVTVASPPACGSARERADNTVAA